MICRIDNFLSERYPGRTIFETVKIYTSPEGPSRQEKASRSVDRAARNAAHHASANNRGVWGAVVGARLLTLIDSRDRAQERARAKDGN